MVVPIVLLTEEFYSLYFINQVIHNSARAREKEFISKSQSELSGEEFSETGY